MVVGLLAGTSHDALDILVNAMAEDMALPAVPGEDQPMWDHVVARLGKEEARPMGMGSGSRKRHVTPVATQATAGRPAAADICTLVGDSD